MSAFAVLIRQLRSPLLGLLAAAAAVSALVGESTDAIVIAVILAGSVGLGFVNEYRAERAGAALHEQIRHQAVVLRAGTPSTVDVIDLVPGDLVRLELGGVVPADIRLVATEELACDETVLTGESASVHKTTAAVARGTTLADLTSAALMGTIVRAGSATGVVVATAHNTAFGRIAAGLADGVHETEFQAGLRRFSGMLAWIAGTLTVVIFAINLILHRPLIDAVLFSLAIAVGITPQLLPAIVTASLAAGTRAMAARGVLVKRLVCVEDLGNTQVLFTDKTGTLTEGRLTLRAALAPDGTPADRPLLLGLLANEAHRHERHGRGRQPVGRRPLAVPRRDPPASRCLPAPDHPPVRSRAAAGQRTRRRTGRSPPRGQGSPRATAGAVRRRSRDGTGGPGPGALPRRPHHRRGQPTRPEPRPDWTPRTNATCTWTGFSASPTRPRPARPRRLPA